MWRQPSLWPGCVSSDSREEHRHSCCGHAAGQMHWAKGWGLVGLVFLGNRGGQQEKAARAVQ